jgi:hypothetical protein
MEATIFIPEGDKQIIEILGNHPLVGVEWRYPVKVDCFFIRSGKGEFNFFDMLSEIVNLCTEAGIFAGNSIGYVLPGQMGWAVDKQRAGTVLRIRDNAQYWRPHLDFKYYLGKE